MNKALRPMVGCEGASRIPRKGLVSTSDATSSRPIVGAAYRKVMDGDFVKVVAWYDNEWG